MQMGSADAGVAGIGDDTPLADLHITGLQLKVDRVALPAHLLGACQRFDGGCEPAEVGIGARVTVMVFDEEHLAVAGGEDKYARDVSVAHGEHPVPRHIARTDVDASVKVHRPELRESGGNDAAGVGRPHIVRKIGRDGIGHRRWRGSS